MNPPPPIWVDERGHRRAKRPCPRCGREVAILSVPTEHLKFWGWKPWQLWSTVEWCGHQIEGIPVPDVGWPVAADRGRGGGGLMPPPTCEMHLVTDWAASQTFSRRGPLAHAPARSNALSRQYAHPRA